MQLKLRLLSDGDAEDVIVDLAGHATVSELASALFPGAAPRGVTGGALGLVVDVDTRERRVLDPTIRVDRSGLRSGSVIGPSSAPATAPPASAAATLTVLEGPDAPVSFELPVGTTSVGRGRDCDITLSDPLVSKRHADVIIGDVVEIVDDSSANGLLMSGRTVPRAVLHPTDRVTLGVTTVSVSHHDQRAGRTDDRSNEVAFNRSPRLDPGYDGIELVAPEPPKPPAPQRFPIAMVVAPIALAAVLYLFTENILSILFFALSPVLIVGSWFENRSAGKKQIAMETARFRTALADLAAQLEYGQELERSGRRHEHPSVVEVVEAVEARGPLVWTRRPEHASFCQVRLGLGTQRSRNTVELPSSNASRAGVSGASKESRPPAWKKSERVMASRGGEASNSLH